MGLETLLREIDKLERIRALGLPGDVFAGASEKLVEAWRARAARAYPSDLRAAPRSVRLTLLAALCWLPPSLPALRDEIERRWGTVPLLDVLKEAALRTGFLEEFASVASRQITDPATLQRRLLLVLFALGTNMGVRQLVATGGHGESEAALRRVRRTHITREQLRRAIRPARHRDLPRPRHGLVG